MQFSEQWLRTLVNPALDSDQLCHLLTMAGLEVEEADVVAPPFSGVVVAQIVSFEKHPDADKLKVCTVDVGQGELLQIVCGAPNVVVGMKAPCAKVGAALPDFQIKAAKLRGVESFGMMCSARELGISQENEGLMVLPEDAPVGQDIRQYLDLDDKSITIKLTPNRPDCLSLAGIAREVAALTHTSFTSPVINPVAPSHDIKRAIFLDAPQACPCYLGRVITGVNTKAPTPAWMKQRLERSGLRSISVVVDVTNYVLLELGQPLHAFDNAELSGAIHVRRPAQGETLKLLNGQEVALSADQLLIADEARPLALAGVMGGDACGVSDKTQDVFLESAFFQPDAIAGRARALGFSSDASHRFERGVDPLLCVAAIERATQLILDTCGGSAGPTVEEKSAPDMPIRNKVTLRPEKACKVIGVDLNLDFMKTTFLNLGMKVEVSSGLLHVEPPSYRFDISIEEDLIEELARVYGYDNIPAIPPKGAISMLPPKEAKRPIHRLRRLLAARDYQEAITYAFVEEAWEKDFSGNSRPVKLANPIASQLAVMRSSLIGGLVGALNTNIRRRATRVRLFETGRCFLRDDSAKVVEGFEQPLRVAALAWGAVTPEQWGSPARKVDFFDVKGDLESILLGKATFVATKHPALHPGRCAAVLIEGKEIGVVGELHPAWVQKYDLGTAPVVFELDLPTALSASIPVAQEVARLPSVTRDIALVVKSTVLAGDLLEALREQTSAASVVRSVDLFDVYVGKGVEDNHKSMALRVLLQHADHTLEEAEIESAIKELVLKAEQKFSARLRT